MRKIPFYPMMVLLIVGLGGYLGCDPNTVVPQLDGFNQGGFSQDVSSAHSPAMPTVVDTSTIPARTAATILVGSFNVQRLGPSKLGDPWVMDKLAQVARRFDVLAIQEITSVDQRTLPTLVDLINSVGNLNYSYTISPRVGRPELGYYEQYAFVFDQSRIEGGPDYSYLVQDTDDVLHREPFVGRFRTRLPQQAFEFSLINIHTDPDEIQYELNVLATVFRNVREYEYPEDDVILLGDLNAAPEDFRNLGQIPGLVPLIHGVPTNIRKNKTIDNILVDRQMTREFTGRAGVIDLEAMFRIEFDDAKRISDHLPIWVEFSAMEAPASVSSVAQGGAGVVR